MLRRRLIPVALLATIASPTLAEDEKIPLTPIDMVELQRLGAPKLSPDGDKLLYLRSHTNWAENKIVRRYHLTDMATKAALPVFDPENEKETYEGGDWAPDGSGFVTILEREEDEAKQAYFYSVETNELSRLTQHPEDIESVSWAPDGGSFYFVAERTTESQIKQRRKDRWVLRDYEARTPKEVWRYHVESAATEQIISGDFYVRGYSLSRDGSKILYMRSPGGLSDDSQQGELWLFDVVSGEDSQLTANAYRESAAKLSPDNLHFAYIATVNEKGEPYYEDNLFVQKVGETKPRLVMRKRAMEILSFSWGQSGGELFFTGNTGLRTELYRLDLNNNDVLTKITKGDHVVGAWRYMPELDTHTAIISSAANPGEIFVMKDEDSGFEQATNNYEAWNARFELPVQEAVQWRGRGGRQIEGILAYPLSYQRGERFPLVTITHGGPRSSSQFGSWNVSRYVAVLAGQGYGVFLPNHRGGTGYGDAFMRDMVGGYFTNAHHDVLDGIDAMIDRGLADPDRLIKMGWSAGGHMTNKMITFTDRFRAASSGAGASDWDSMFGESDVRYNRTFIFGGPPWTKQAPLKNYARQSLLKDAWRATTPTLFFAGEKDVRVPPTQSILLYRGLKAAGVETELFLAPGEPHNFRKPSHRLFKINRELKWYARHVLGTEYEMTLPAEADTPRKKEDNEEKDE